MNDLAAYVLVAFAMCVTPGAGVLFTVGNAFRYGKKNAWRSPVGNAIGITVISALSATGLGALIVATPSVFTLLQAAGVLVMVWLGWKNWRAPAMDVMALGKAGAIDVDRGAKSVIRNAALLQASNPMLFVFLLSLLPQFVNPNEPGCMPRMAALLAVFVGICLLVHLAYSYAACFANRLLHGKRFSFWMNHISAVLFWLIAASVAAGLVKQHLPL